MAFAYSRLKEIAYLPGASAAQYTLPASTTAYVRLIVLHNTHTAGLEVTLNAVPNGDGETAANQFYKDTIVSEDTIFIEFPTPGLILSTAGDAIEGVCGTASKVTIQIFGGTE